jgi:hypothetical protein
MLLFTLLCGSSAWFHDSLGSFAKPDPSSWVILVSTSFGWDEPEIDMCEAYQGVRLLGVPQNRIIVMDDVGRSSQNPHRRLSDSCGVEKDFAGDDVTAETILGVLTGDRYRTDGGKVLQSTSEDGVFLYITGQAYQDLLPFPRAYLSSDQLMHALDLMHTKRMFRRLHLFLDVGSPLFVPENLVQNLPANVFVQTRTREGVRLCPHDLINGIPITCLCKEGSKDRSEEEFEHLVHIRDIPLHLAYYRYLRAEPGDSESRYSLAKKLLDVMERRILIDSLREALESFLVSLHVDKDKHKPTHFNACFRQLDSLLQKCIGLDAYSSTLLHLFNHLCQQDEFTHDLWSDVVQSVHQRLISVCF